MALLFSLADRVEARRIIEQAPELSTEEFATFALPLLMRAMAHIEKVEGAVHAAVSWSYMDGEKPRLQSRIDLKRAMGWPLTDGEEERLKELIDA